MFVSDAMIREMELQFGVPAFKEYIIPTSLKEVTRITTSQKDGRNHDVTLYIMKNDKIVVIAKHFYPPGLFRAPSGGLHPGESFLSGINREVAEETGCEIMLRKFLLRTSINFQAMKNGATGADQTKDVHWRSFVFLADYLKGDFQFTDHDEIREVRLAGWHDFETYGNMMRQIGSGGFLYRAALHETILSLLGR
jgi:8-oxo-dGTP pyrophosphatase MutT (NUDIX family)